MVLANEETLSSIKNITTKINWVGAQKNIVTIKKKDDINIYFLAYKKYSKKFV